LARLCLRIAWFYRYKGEEEDERKYLEYACRLYEESFEQEGEGIAAKDNVIIYLIR